MCSGCSGDYAWGFEDLDDPVNEESSSNGPTCWNRAKEGGNRLSAERVAGLEDSPRAQRGSQRGNLLGPGSVRESGLEGCEMLVTATHIVEIRVFGIDSERMRELLENESGTGCAQ